MKKILAWVVGVFLILGAVMLLTELEIVSALACLVAGFIVLPVSSAVIKFKIHWGIKLLIVVICLVIAGSVRITEKGKAEMVEKKEKARIEAEIKAKVKAEEEAKKPIKLKNKSTSIDKVHFDIRSYYWADSLNVEGKTLTPKNSFLVIEVSVANHSKVARNAFFYLTDSKNKEYKVQHYLFDDNNHPIDIPWPNGKSQTNELVFDVSKNEQYSLYIGVKGPPEKKQWASINWESVKQK